MAQRIPREFINTLLERTDIVALIDSYVPLKKGGSNFMACCPFHNENTPSFSVSPRKQFYHCFGCGVSGNAVTFLLEYEHLNFVEAIEVLASQAGLTVPVESHSNHDPRSDHSTSNISNTSNTSKKNAGDIYELMESANHFYQQQLRQHPGGKEAIAYLKQRGISGEIAQQFQIGFAPPAWDLLLKKFRNQQNQLLDAGMVIRNDRGKVYDRFRERILFPIRDRRGRVIGFGGRSLGDGTPKYLNSPETTIFHKGKEVYGLHQVMQLKPLPETAIIVEGYMDVIALAQYGVKNAVATLGTAISVDHIQLLSRYFSQIIFCFDGDSAGMSAAWRALNNCLPRLNDRLSIKFMFLPQGEDPDSFIRKKGETGFREMMNDAMSLDHFFFDKLTKECDITSVDGKSKLLSMAGELILEIPAGPRREMMLDQLSRRVHLSIDRLEKTIKKARAPRSKNAVAQKPKKKRGKLSSMRLAIALLLQNPHLISAVTQAELLAQFKGPGYDMLNRCIALIQAKPDVSTGALLESWRDHADFQHVLMLSSWEHYVPEEGIEAEFQGALQRIIQHGSDQEIKLLLNKANHVELSLVERQRLQSLIRASKVINP